MISKKGIVLFTIAIAGFLFIIYNYAQQANQQLNNSSTLSQPLSKEGQAAKAVFVKTINATNDKDIKTYLTALIPKARANTEKQLANFFKTQNVTNTLQSFKVLDENSGHLLAEAKVKSINNNKNQKQYRDNIATLDVSYVKQKDGSWLIDLTTTINTQLLK